MARSSSKAESSPRAPSRTGARAPWAGGRFRWWLLGICGVALVLRVAVGAHLAATSSAVAHPGDGTDMATYQSYARAILDGSYPYAEGFYYQPFYYAVFLPAVYATHLGHWGVILAQALLGALTVWLIGLSFAQLGGRRCGLLAAAILALARMPIFYTPFTLIATLQSFWMALILWLGLRALRRRPLLGDLDPTAALAGTLARRPQWWRWALLGLAAGCANATRGNILLLLPAILLALALDLRSRWQQAVLAAAILLGCFYLPQLPFAWANYRATGHWTGPSTAAGAVLALGNTPEAPPGGRDPGTGAGPMEYPPSYGDWMAREADTGPASRSVPASAWEWARREPLAFLELKLRMALLFWHRSAIPNNVALPAPGQRAAGGPVGALLTAPLPLLGFAPIGIFGLLGLALALRRWRHPGWLLAGGLTVCYAGSILVFYMLERFRLPVLPLLCGFAAWGMLDSWRRWQTWRRLKTARARQPILAAFGLLLVAGLLVIGGMDLYRARFEAAVMRLARPNGVQVDMLSSQLVYDHGPFSFGGWYVVGVDQVPQVRKTFRLIPVETAAQRPTADSPWPMDRAVLHLPLAGLIGPTDRGQVQLVAAIGDQTVSQLVVEVVAGLQWVDLPLGLDPQTLNMLLSQDSLELTLAVLPAPGFADKVGLLFDAQRDYGRTVVANQRPAEPVPGEWVGDLILHKHVYAAPTAPALPDDLVPAPPEDEAPAPALQAAPTAPAAPAPEPPATPAPAAP